MSSGERLARLLAPPLAQLSWPWLEGTAHALLAGGVGLLAGAVFVGDAAWIRAAAAVLALGPLAFGLVLVRILGHLRPGLRNAVPAFIGAP